jgi:hypothetical protein
MVSSIISQGLVHQGHPLLEAAGVLDAAAAHRAQDALLEGRRQPIAAPDHDQDEADRHSRRGAREVAQIPQHEEERRHAERGHGDTVVRARQDHRQEQEQEQRNEVARGHPPGEPEVQHERAGQSDHLGMAVGPFGKRSQSAVARDEPKVSRVSGIVQDDACQVRHEDAQSEHLDQIDRRFPVAAHDGHRQQNQ